VIRGFFPALVGAILSFGPVLGAAQQSGMAGMSMPEMKAIPAPDQLPVPQHMTGIGNSHIKITATPEAQVWFDQGLSLQHDFWDYEAAKAYEQGVRVDPNCAMCYWGLFQIEGFRDRMPTQSYGTAALKQASRLKEHTSQAEQLYIEAAEAQAAAKEGEHPEVPILRKLVAENPQDVQARIFLAGALNDGFDDKGEPKAGTREAISILEGVLRDAPNDSAANHYWIHAMEPGNHPERAINSAALLASLAPNSGHMVHMPGHIYYRVGDYASAEHWFAESTEVDERYMREQHVSPDDDWNYVHNMMYAIANLMEQGKLSQANTLSDRLGNARGELSTTLYIWSSRDDMARINNRLPVALRTGDWTGVVKLVDEQRIPEKDSSKNLRALDAALHEYATGMAALERKDVAAAKAASDAMDAGLWRAESVQNDKMKMKDPATKQDDASKPATMPVMPDADSEPMLKAMRIASLELRAAILVQEKNLAEGKTLFAEARRQEKELGYHEPPGYVRPVAETEGDVLLKAGDFAGAQEAYKAELQQRPNSGFGLYGLARAEDLGGDQAAAKRDYEAFLKAWHTADATLPQLAEARKALGVQVASGR
jgi:tetratricopeptide (TPR) repeat protein